MNLTILDMMFPKQVVEEKYFAGCDMIMKATRCEKNDIENASIHWAEAGLFFLNTDMFLWGCHLIEYSQALERHIKRNSSLNFPKSIRTKKTFIPQPSKFKKLLMGWTW